MCTAILYFAFLSYHTASSFGMEFRSNNFAPEETACSLSLSLAFYSFHIWRKSWASPTVEDDGVVVVVASARSITVKGGNDDALPAVAAAADTTVEYG